MCSNCIRIMYAQGKTLCLQDSLAEAVHFAFTVAPWHEYEPLMLQLHGKKLYWDKNLCRAFDAKELPEAELIARTQCLGLFRNWLEVETGDDPIEPGALWKQTDAGYILVDDDRYHCEPPDAEGFE